MRRNSFKIVVVFCIMTFSSFYSFSEENVINKIVDKVVEFVSSPFKKKLKKVDLSELKKYTNTQNDIFLKVNEKIIEIKEKQDPNNRNLLLERSIIESVKGNKEKAKEYIEKANAVQSSTNDGMSIKDQIKENKIVEEVKDEFVFDEDLVMLLADEFTDNYEVSTIKALMVKTSGKKLSDKELEAEMKKIADKFYKNIKSGKEAKELIEKTIAQKEYKLALEFLERANNDKFLDDIYYTKTRGTLISLIEEQRRLEEELARKKLEEEERLRKEAEFAKKVYEEEQKKKLSANKFTVLLGSKLSDSAQAVAIGVDGIYVTGYSYGDYNGIKNNGDSDIIVSKIDFSGNIVWAKMFGSGDSDSGTGIAVGEDGIYLTGSTRGDIDGKKAIGDADVFISKYDFNGNRKWTNILGTVEKDKSKSIAIGKDGIYVTGTTKGDIDGAKNNGMWDIFVAKYDFSGNKRWTKLYGGSSHDESNTISVVENDLYVAGYTLGAFDLGKNKGKSDAFLIKLNGSGNKVWTKMFGSTDSDYINSISAGFDGVYVTGETAGVIGSKSYGNSDIFVSKFSHNGELMWSRQIGSVENDFGYYTFARLDEVYVTGRTKGAINGNNAFGKSDIFVGKFDASGNLKFAKTYGTSEDDECYGLCVGLDFYYIIGETRGKLNDKTNNGGLDAFVMMLSNE